MNNPGDIAKRNLEKLGEADKGIILFRKMLMQQMEIVRDGAKPTINYSSTKKRTANWSRRTSRWSPAASAVATSTSHRRLATAWTPTRSTRQWQPGSNTNAKLSSRNADPPDPDNVEGPGGSCRDLRVSGIDPRLGELSKPVRGASIVTQRLRCLLEDFLADVA